MKKNAFTLAEVLITLGIIGVVAATTMPTLMSGHQNRTYATQLRKLCTDVSHATMRYKTDNNLASFDEARLTNSNINENLLKKYFSVAQDCGTSYLPCFGSLYRSLDGASSFSPSSKTCGGSVILSSGASICATIKGSSYYDFVVDVNGPKPPNITGRDFFGFTIDEKGTPYDAEWSTGVLLDKTSVYPMGIGRIIEDGWQIKY